jgi:hypothetical protein
MDFTRDEQAQMPIDQADNGGERDQVDLISWIESGYVRAHFGDVPVRVTPELAVQILDSCEKSHDRS